MYVSNNPNTLTPPSNATSVDIRFSESSQMTEVLRALGGAERIAVTSHANPDPDAYASSVALAYGLRKLGKEAVCVNLSGVVPEFTYLPLVSEVQTNWRMENLDLVVVTDCSSLSGLGREIEEINPAGAPIVNLDHHHLSNSRFGTLNIVSHSVSCASELAYVVLRDLGVPFDAQLATLLLAGIYSDTLSLQKLITSPETFQVVKELFALGGNLESFADQMYRNTPAHVLKLTGRILSSSEPQCGGRYLPIVVDLSEVKMHGITEQALASLKILPLEVSGVELGAFIRVDRDECRVSLRSKGEVDVRRLADSFGGHGHKNAAGFVYRGTATALIAELEAKVDEILKK